MNIHLQTKKNSLVFRPILYDTYYYCLIFAASGIWAALSYIDFSISYAFLLVIFIEQCLIKKGNFLDAFFEKMALQVAIFKKKVAWKLFKITDYSLILFETSDNRQNDDDT